VRLMQGDGRGEFDRLMLVAGEDEDAQSFRPAEPRRGKLVVIASATIAVAVAGVVAKHAGLLDTAVLTPSSLELEQKTLAEQRCGHVEEHVDYLFDVLAGVGHVDNVASYQECCAICKAEPDCQAYTWVKDAKLVSGNPGQCWLKGGLYVSKAHKHGVYSAFSKRPHGHHGPHGHLGHHGKHGLHGHLLANGGKKAALNLRAGDSEREEMAKLVAEAAKVGDVVMNKKDVLAAKMKAKKEEHQQANEIEQAEQRWAEDTLKKKAERLQEKLANQKAEQELRRKANILVRRKSKELAANLAKMEEEAKKQPQMSKQEPVGGVQKVDAKYATCASIGEGCLKSKCCKNAGNQCFTKNAWWAQCMPECNKGPNPVDQVSPMPWECDALGDRKPGEPEHCALDGENCLSPKCCMKGGTTCFAKNATWAQCKASCAPGPDLQADDSQPWTCQKFGSRTVGAAPWVATKCASNGMDCSKAACCMEPNHQCYMQDQFYAECKPTCMPGEKLHAWDKAWSCEEVGSRTPAIADDAKDGKGRVGAWMEKECSDLGDNCLTSQCCLGVDYQCYTKNEYWAACQQTCSTDPDPKDNNATWTCKAVGPRSWGLALKGSPSLYCITLYMPSSYEKGLLQYQIDVNGGIFACDGYNTYAAEPDTLRNADGLAVEAIQIPKIKVGKSQDGTAGNAKLFMAVWDKVIAGGKFRNYDWTIKVDADAVMLPWRVRDHMRPHVGEKVYVVNCNKYPDSPNFPMMYGSMEIFSQPAMAVYAKNSWKCGKELPWAAWGEDYFMTKCMDYVGVDRIADFGVIGDNVCTGANCEDSYTGAFHPFKSVDTWKECWLTATTG